MKYAQHVLGMAIISLFLLFDLAEAHTRSPLNVDRVKQVQLYDDQRVITWSKDFLDGNQKRILDSVEIDLKSDLPHPFAPHVWTVTQFSQGRLKQAWVELKDPKLRAALGPLPEIFQLYEQGQYKKLLTDYPPSRSRGIKDVWALHYLAIAAEEEARKEDALIYELASARLYLDNFLAAWVISANLMSDERVRAKVEAIIKSGEFANTLTGEFLSSGLQQLPTNAGEDKDDLSAIDAWLVNRPRDARALRRKGLILISLSRIEQAVDLLEQATVAYPFKVHWVEHTTALIKLGRLSDARRVAVRSISLESGNTLTESPLTGQEH